MVYLMLFLAELVILHFLSKGVTLGIYKAFFRITGNRDWAIYLLAILFFPGTFVHEISHFLVALFLLVPVGELELLPQVQEGGVHPHTKRLGVGVKMGSVAIANTDNLRRFLIGVAPFVLGTGLILGGTYFAVQNSLILKPFYLLPFIYLLFAISNTMFASKSDLKGAFKLFLFTLFLYILILIVGVNFPFLKPGVVFTPVVLEVLKLSNLYLLLPLAVDLLLLVTLKAFSN